jgi:hypothetical protein
MPKRTDLNSILILGSGPIVIAGGRVRLLRVDERKAGRVDIAFY